MVYAGPVHRLALIALLLAGSAAACTTTPGFMLNGAVRLQPAFTPVCDAVTREYERSAVARSGGRVGWVEVYRAAPRPVTAARRTPGEVAFLNAWQVGVAQRAWEGVMLRGGYRPAGLASAGAGAGSERFEDQHGRAVQAEYSWQQGHVLILVTGLTAP